MSIIRAARPQSNFYILDKRISEDKGLTWAARGLLIFLLGKPDNWRISPEHLRKETEQSSKPTGRDGIYALLAELITSGYVERKANRKDDGTLAGYDYIVYDEPILLGDVENHPFPALPDTAAPDTAQPFPANPTLTSTDYKQVLIEERTEDPMSGKPDDAVEILDFLNARTKSGYRAVSANLDKIRARLLEGATADEMKQVISRKASEWLGTTMEKYLRPETLFNATKYNQYAGQLGKPLVRHGTDDRMAQMKIVADELTGRSTSYDDDADNPFTIEAATRRIA
jgi:uncharacterized phage protein (TIGR02220 family)